MPGDEVAPELDFRVNTVDEGTFPQPANITGEYGRLPSTALGERIWYVALHYHSQSGYELTVITVPKLPEIAAPPAVLQIGLDEAHNLAITRIMELTHIYRLPDSVVWQPSQIWLAGNPRAGDRFEVERFAATVFDLGDVVGAVIGDVNDSAPRVNFTKDARSIAWAPVDG